jgi:hypothetical protein
MSNNPARDCTFLITLEDEHPLLHNEGGDDVSVAFIPVFMAPLDCPRLWRIKPFLRRRTVGQSIRRIQEEMISGSYFHAKVLLETGRMG